jgi:phytoene dehydrogenase-like protein
MPEKKNVIIIGAGITGLTTGLSLLKEGKTSGMSVLIIEQNKEVGGYVRSFSKNGYTFDTAQMVPNIIPMMKFLGLSTPMKQYKGYYARIFHTHPKTGEVKPYKVPSSIQGFEYYLVNRFYKDAKAIKKFFSYSKKMYDELFKMKYNPGFTDKLKMPFACSRTLLHSGTTFEKYYQSFGIQSPEIKEIFNVFATFSGLPPERVAALLIVGTMFSTLEGTYRPMGPFESLPNEMMGHFLNLGGEIMTQTKVDKIMVVNKKAIGVRLQDGRVVHCDKLVTTIDPKVAIKQLLDIDLIRDADKKYARKVESMQMSASSLHICLGVDDGLDLSQFGFDCGYNVLTTGGNTFDKLFEAFDLGKTAFSPNLFQCGVVVPFSANPKKNTLIIRVVPMPPYEWIEMREKNNWLYEKEKNDVADFFIALVERYLIPGLHRHIVVREIATPATFARVSGSPTGSNFDMAPFPDNFGRNRLSMLTPIQNLIQPKFSHGIFPSMLSGLQAADHLLNGKIMKGYCRLPREAQ